VSFAAITLYVVSQRVFIVVVVDFSIHSVRKLLDTPSYLLSLFLSYVYAQFSSFVDSTPKQCKPVLNLHKRLSVL
jgi:hypothetical protein